MRLGMNTVIFGGSDLETALQHVEWAGFANVELSAIQGMGTTHLNNADEAEKIKELLAKHNLTATATEAATTDPTRLEEVMKAASAVGIQIVNVGSGGATGDEDSTVAAINLMRDFAKMAADNGVTLAVKPHVGQAIYNADTGLRLMEEVTTGAIGLNFDPSHLARADDDPAKVAPRWGSKIVTSHFRDCPVRVPGPPGTPEQQIPGRGALDLPEILAALRSIDYNGPVNLEIIGAAGYEISRAMGIAAESRGYLHRCLKEIGWVL
jgi:sugar phosphate isomerase/epimerase